MKEEYPIIWKKEKCLVGQCEKLSQRHLWSIPFSTPFGLVSECFLCKKNKRIYIEKDGK